jgi:predicted dehydrogenase
VDRVGVGIIGASLSGGWAMQAHVPALLRLPRFQLQAVCTTRQETARSTAREVGAPHAYSDARALANDPTVDLVVVACKVPGHADAVMAAVEAGKMVYCEWPLGVDAAQARHLRDAATNHHVRNIVGLQARLSPVVRQLRDLIRAGHIGRVLSVRLFSAGLGLGGPVLPANREWAADRANGLSALTVRTAHTIDAMCFAVAPIAELSAELIVATPSPVIAGTTRTVVKTAPDQVIVSGKLVGGASFSGQFLLGVRPLLTPLLTVFGTAGTLSVVPDAADGQVQMNTLELWGAQADDAPQLISLAASDAAPEEIVPAGPALGVARLYRAIIENHGQAGDLVPDFAEAVALHGVLEAIERAATAGERQLLHQARR